MYASTARGSTPSSPASRLRSRAVSISVPVPTTRAAGSPDASCATSASTSTGLVATTSTPSNPAALSSPTTSRTMPTFFSSRSSRLTSGPPLGAPAVPTATGHRAASA